MRDFSRKSFLCGVLTLYFIGLCACSNGTPAASPTFRAPESTISPTETTQAPTEVPPAPTPSPEAVMPTPTPGALTPIVIVQPTLQETPTSEAVDADLRFPAAQLRFQKPGEMSRLTSPILVIADVLPGYKGMVNLQLFGENGRLISDQLLQLQEIESGWVSLASEVKFDSQSAGESGLVVLTTRDYYGRRMAQVGVPVLLLQIGESEYEFPQFAKQPVVLDLPVAGGFARKGSLHIGGMIHLYNDNPIIVELVTQGGGITASKAVTVVGNESAEFVPFSLDVPYKVSTRTPVRLSLIHI